MLSLSGLKNIHLLKAAFHSIVIAYCLFFLLPIEVHAQADQAHDPEKEYAAPKDPLVQQKLSHWKTLKFGLFMHWGTYSQWGIVESWSICPEDWPWNQRTGPYADDYFQYKKAYENLQTTFNPTKFNPNKWATAAREAGMKYMVFTAKHHDGFCMYDSKYTEYKITSSKTPFSSHPLSNITKEVFTAFRKQNFMVGAYFSKPDWNSEYYWWRRFPPKDRHQSYDKKKYPDRWKKFGEFTYNQMKELMTVYGKVDLLWIDGNWAALDMDPMVMMARQHQPGLIVVDRHGAPQYVNYLTPEQKVPSKYMDVPWETCMTMGKSWSYIPNEVYKPTRQLVQLLIDIVAKNGNLLLDIGPGPDGEWHEEAYQRLREIGQWMKTNGESIYDTKPVAPYRQDQWAFTTNGKSLFVSYLPADEEQELPGKMKVPIPPSYGYKKQTVKLLGFDKDLSWKSEGEQLVVTIPEAARKQLTAQPAWVFKIQ